METYARVEPNPFELEVVKVIKVTSLALAPITIAKKKSQKSDFRLTDMPE
jgi:hypothetical protein